MTAPGPPPPDETAPEPGVRLSPYELVFVQGGFESSIFPRIEEEAATAGVDSSNAERFEFLSTVGDVLREVTPEDAPPEALEQYRALLFQAFNFWRAGRRLYYLEQPVARYLVESSPSLAEWRFQMPAPAAYLQLPQQLFWSSISPASTPEPVDGFFLTSRTGTDPRDQSYHRIEVLVVLGVHRSRAGFSVIPVGASTGPGIDDFWTVATRPEGDFANVLPGGEIAGLYSIVTGGEVLKLVARTLWYVHRFPEDRVDVVGSEARAGAHGPTTRLAHTLITLDRRIEADVGGDG